MDHFRTKVSALRQALLTLQLTRTPARLRRTAVVCCGLLGVLLSWIGMQFQGVPEPSLPIEYANLLAAETFASGHLALPAVPSGFFLQTYLTLTSPTYAAAVPPGPGLLLSLGVLLGDPLYGLWLSVGLFIATVTWMLLGFTSLRWAVLGGLIASIWFGTLSFWAQSYGSPVATGIGAALLWGATRRYSASHRRADAALAGLGAGWLWLCNPVAALFAIPIPIILLGRSWLIRKKTNELALLLAGTIGAILFQLTINHATTGSAWTSAAALYEHNYNVHPQFLWQQARVAPHYDFWRMEQYDVMVSEPSSRLPTPVGTLWLARLEEFCLFYFGIPGVILLSAGLLLGTTRWALILILGATTSVLSMFVIIPLSMSVTAPTAPVAILLMIWSFRRVWSSRIAHGKDCWRPTWIFISAFSVIAIYRGFAFSIPQEIRDHRAHKSALVKHLLESGERHLVVVKYAIETSPHVEYVYNGSNPDTQDIVWARWHESADMNPLFERFKNRKLWMLTIIPKGEPELRPLDWAASAPHSPSNTQIGSPTSK